jgi:hypothetical protein
MRAVRQSTQFLINEALSLLTRLSQVKPFALTMPMVPAATVSDEALKGITDLLMKGNRELYARVRDFISFMRSPQGRNITAAEAQGQFSLLKLRFNELLDQLDIFADVLSQRAEHETGVWVAGLDVLAADALELPAQLYEAPSMICFLERGHGAAIRRAKSKLPGGDESPVAVIQIPRERMVGSGIASSLVHEVGHQGAALLDLVHSLREEIKQRMAADPRGPQAWKLYSFWISEIIADLWAVAHLGIGATYGLINVVSLPRYFVFRIGVNDPHPFAWIRVKISIAFGRVLYPHPQWDHLEQLWEQLYPKRGLKPQQLRLLSLLEQVLPDFADLVVHHSSSSLKGRHLGEVFPSSGRQPAHLQALYEAWQEQPDLMAKAKPSLVFAVIGQARADASIDALTESRILMKLLSRWALIRSESRSPRESRQIMGGLRKVITN